LIHQNDISTIRRTIPISLMTYVIQFTQNELKLEWQAIFLRWKLEGASRKIWSRAGFMFMVAISCLAQKKKREREPEINAPPVDLWCP